MAEMKDRCPRCSLLRGGREEIIRLAIGLDEAAVQISCKCKDYREAVRESMVAATRCIELVSSTETPGPFVRLEDQMRDRLTSTKGSCTVIILDNDLSASSMETLLRRANGNVYTRTGTFYLKTVEHTTQDGEKTRTTYHQMTNERSPIAVTTLGDSVCFLPGMATSRGKMIGTVVPPLASSLRAECQATWMVLDQGMSIITVFCVETYESSYRRFPLRTMVVVQTLHSGLLAYELPEHDTYVLARMIGSPKSLSRHIGGMAFASIKRNDVPVKDISDGNISGLEQAVFDKADGEKGWVISNQTVTLSCTPNAQMTTKYFIVHGRDFMTKSLAEELRQGGHPVPRRQPSEQEDNRSWPFDEVFVTEAMEDGHTIYLYHIIAPEALRNEHLGRGPDGRMMTPQHHELALCHEEKTQAK